MEINIIRGIIKTTLPQSQKDKPKGGSNMKKILKIIAAILICLCAAFAALLLFLSATEYRPEEITAVSPEGNASETVKSGDTIRVLTWNIGYGALGSNADFFMDGGKMVRTADRERVLSNITAIADEIREEAPDIVFLQEADQNSGRSHHIDETAFFREQFSGMESALALNYSVKFVPYPFPPIGQVNSGIQTLSNYAASEVSRIQLPCPFSWPVRLGNLKRCLLISRIPVENSDRELVLINLHLEAYDDGEGKAAQTAMLKEYLEKEAAAGNYVIAGGDFNQTFSNQDQSAYEAQEGKWKPGIIDTGEFDGSLQFLMDSSVPSCRSLDQVYDGADQESFQYYLIDGFIVSGNLAVKYVTGIDCKFQNTDHNPVMLELRLE